MWLTAFLPWSLLGRAEVVGVAVTTAVVRHVLPLVGVVVVVLMMLVVSTASSIAATATATTTTTAVMIATMTTTSPSATTATTAMRFLFAIGEAGKASDNMAAVGVAAQQVLVRHDVSDNAVALAIVGNIHDGLHDVVSKLILHEAVQETNVGNVGVHLVDVSDFFQLRWIVASLHQLVKNDLPHVVACTLVELFHHIGGKLVEREGVEMRCQ